MSDEHDARIAELETYQARCLAEIARLRLDRDRAADFLYRAQLAMYGNTTALDALKERDDRNAAIDPAEGQP